MKLFFFILLILIIIGLGYYYLVWKPSEDEKAAAAAVPSAPPVGPIVPLPPPPPTSKFKVGDDVYLNAAVGNPAGNNAGIPIYNFPAATSSGTYLVGTVRHEWYPGVKIGTIVEIGTTYDWVKVSLNNLQIWQFTNGSYTIDVAFLTGGYWFSESHLSKTPY